MAAPGRLLAPDANRTTYSDSVGTSFAAPLVASTASYIWGRFPFASPTAIRRAILESSRPPETVNEDQLGYGLLDVSAALAYLTTMYSNATALLPGMDGGL